MKQNRVRTLTLNLGLSNSVQINYQSLGHNYILPRDRAITVSAGQGYHSMPGYAGQMSCMVQILLRILYGHGSSPSSSEFELKFFEISPMGSILLEQLSHYDGEFGNYNLFDSIRLVIRYMTEEMTRLYVPPRRSQYDANRKSSSILF